MVICEYLNATGKYNVRFEQVDNHIARLAGDIPADTSGFILSRIGHDDKWDYSSFTTIYRKGDGFIEYSNDGSIYVEPEPVPRPDPIPSDPSYGERITALENRLDDYEAAYQEGVQSA